MDVRISSNPTDTDVQKIMKMLMVNRIEHKKFDPILGEVSTRSYLKGLIFQDSELSPYLKYVHPPEVGSLISQEIKNSQSKVQFKNNLLKQDNSSQSLSSQRNKKKMRAQSLLPSNLEAKDFQQASWLLSELNKPSYYGSLGSSEKIDP